MALLGRTGILVLIALASVNVWTGAPLAALWIGSRVQGDSSTIKMEALFSVIVFMGLFCFGLVQALARLNHMYDQAIGRAPVRRQTPWLRAMSGERQKDIATAVKPTAVEYVLVG